MVVPPDTRGLIGVEQLDEKIDVSMVKDRRIESLTEDTVPLMSAVTSCS